MPNSKSAKRNPDDRSSAAHALMSKSPAGTEAIEEMADRESASHKERGPLKVAEPDTHPSEITAAPSSVRPVNLRRSTHALQLFGLLFVIMLLLFGAMLTGIYSFYENKIRPYLGKEQPAAPVATPAAGPSPVPAALKIEIPPQFTQQIADATSKIVELQKQIDSMRDSSSSTEGRLRELTDRVAAAATAAAQQPAKSAELVSTLAADGKPASEVAEIVPVTSQTNKELVLLKERNRLTAWADEAIAKGDRKSLDMLIKRLTDPDFTSLHDAAFAEIQRIYYHLRFTIRIDPNYRIPVNEMFKDSGIREDADLTTEQLIKLLHDHEQIWEVRLRGAWLLGGRRTRDVSEALIKAIKEDPVLDVAKEAQLSLEQNVDRKFLLLDIPAIDEWWKTQTEVKSDALPTKEPEKKEPAPAESKKKKAAK